MPFEQVFSSEGALMGFTLGTGYALVIFFLAYYAPQCIEIFGAALRWIIKLIMRLFN